MSGAEGPTPQDIETIRAMLVTHLMSAVEKDPDTVRHVARLLDTGDRVLDYAAACVEAEEEGERVPEVEAPEDAGAEPLPANFKLDRHGMCGGRGPAYCRKAGSCGRHNACVYVDIKAIQPSQPPTDPEARVAAMTDKQVEDLVTDRGVGDWLNSPDPGDQRQSRVWAGYAIDDDGACLSTQNGAVGVDPYDDKRGDTTTEAGRMACTRRLAVHLLRAEEAE